MHSSSSDASCTRLTYDTDIPPINAATPWEYLEDVARMYDNVERDRTRALRFVDGGMTVVPPDLAEGMLVRGCAVEWVCGGLVQFHRIDRRHR